MDRISAGSVAVIFVSRRTRDDPDGYAVAARAMDVAAAAMPGYLGVDSVRDADGIGITVSYWRDMDAAAAWRDDSRHRAIQRSGRARWYADYAVFVTTVDRAYAWIGPTDGKKKASPMTGRPEA